MVEQKDLDMMRQMMQQVVREEISPLAERMGRLESKVDRLESKVNSLESKVDSLESKVNSLEAKMDSLESKVDSLEAKVNSLESKVNSLEAKVNSLKADVDSLKEKVAANAHAIQEVQATLENDIDRKISIIAEGHLDISRNLEKAIRVSQTQEEYQLRVVALETEVRRLGNRLKVENA